MSWTANKQRHGAVTASRWAETRAIRALSFSIIHESGSHYLVFHYLHTSRVIRIIRRERRRQTEREREGERERKRDRERRRERDKIN
jgi:hypothetical protein